MAIKKRGKTDFLSGIKAESFEKTEEESKPVEVEVKHKIEKEPVREIEEEVEEVKEEPVIEIENDFEEEYEAPSVQRPAKRKKNIDNWGRPRKLLIEGVKEKSLTVQLPETLIKAMRREAKKQGKSMKEMIGTACLEKYANLLKK